MIFGWPGLRWGSCLIAAGLFEAQRPAMAASSIEGASLSWPWALPFLGLLLCIATGPLLFARVWHHHYGKIAAAWALLAIAPLALRFGLPAAWAALVHALVAEYLSFIILLFALYVVAGGILISGNLRCTPAANTALLGVGTAVASLVGTTGAAMILIRPLLRANARRRHKVHVVIFFIILVANVGGALTPLGDPPLFVGFLRGVAFGWPAQHLWLQTAITAGLLLCVFALLDTWFARGTGRGAVHEPVRLRIRGAVNLGLIGAIIASIVLSAAWNPGLGIDLFGTQLALQNVVRDATLIAIALLSLRLTPDEHRDANAFSWEPIREVAILFAGIFVAIVPVLAMLQAGPDGPFAPLLDIVTASDGRPREAAYFWLTGILSAFLDNAPTYLVFFELAGGDAATLMGRDAGTLAAISMGAVYMGALTYIGNAPNFMVYAIATERGIKMPSFFGYLFWAASILVPIFLLLTLLPLAPVVAVG